jgi:hypothetical protein
MRETSVQAFHAIRESGLLSQRRWEAYEGLYQHGPMTSSELDAAMGVGWRTTNKRLPELERMGVVKILGTRPCGVTGMDAMVWDVTSESMPRPFHKTNSGARAIERTAIVRWLRTRPDLFVHEAADAIEQGEHLL